MRQRTMMLLEGADRLINKLGRYLLVAVFAFCLLCLFKIQVIQGASWETPAFVLGSMGVLIGLFLLFKLSLLKLSDRQALLLLTVLALVFFSFWNFVFRPVPVSDYKVLLEGARDIVDGTFKSQAAQPDNYFRYYNFQIGYAYYLSLIMRLFGDRLLFFKIIEMLVMTATTLVLYKTFRLFCDVHRSVFGAGVFTLFPYVFIGVGIINNQHEGLLLEALAIYFILKRRSWPNLLIAAVCIAIAQVLRPTAVVVAAAIIVTLMIQTIQQKSRQRLLETAAFIVTCWGLGWITNKLFILSGVAPYGIKVGNPYFKFLIGLTGKGVSGKYTTSARKTQLYYDLKEYHFNYALYKQAAAEKLKNVLIHGVNLQDIMNRFTGFIGNVDNQYYLGGNEQFMNRHPVLISSLNFAGMVVYSGTVLGTFKRVITEKWVTSRTSYLLPAVVFGMFFFAYIFMETQARYRFELYYVLFLLAVPTIYGWLTTLQEKMFTLDSSKDSR
ncbi:glycosyltransferase family 39 protein [Lacticaseibacillus zeae]|nr:glycosyltransferase family 39 protein [Lacticaseibacillus zeae]